ncbi:MAG: crossover junction endodeoxyribonuclease RuvC [Elusimicrobia bacterium]|nr:crossover junction endodeoxyribonuclease RuvC [Elusimicrobiota bacterium]
MIQTERVLPRPRRLEQLFDGIEETLKMPPVPQIVALEEAHLPPKGIRISNLMGLGEARGVLMLAASRIGVNVVPVHALQVKTTITGRSQSTKQDVARFLRHLIGGVGESLIDDTTDAVAIALSVALTHTKSYLLNPIS